MRSDESSLGFLRYTIFFIKFNHLYLGVCVCVCFCVYVRVIKNMKYDIYNQAKDDNDRHYLCRHVSDKYFLICRPIDTDSI